MERGTMSKPKKSWKEKLQDDKDLPRVITMDGKLSKQWGEGTCVIPAPREVDELMRKVRRGQLTTINAIRKALAARHGATIACPITTGIFARIAAEAAAEEKAQGKKRVTPYWRTLKGAGELNPKYPGGCEVQKARLEEEGHTVTQKGRKFIVEEVDKHLARIERLDGAVS
jgi:alkylated DNA nucleotide flippase Atl1